MLMLTGWIEGKFINGTQKVTNHVQKWPHFCVSHSVVSGGQYGQCTLAVKTGEAQSGVPSYVREALCNPLGCIPASPSMGFSRQEH